MNIEEKFHQELVEKCAQAKRMCGYNPTRLLQMLAAHGGVQTARELIRKGRISDGFTALEVAGRLDLTLEATVTAARYAQLFTDDEVNACYQLLCECGYDGF